jgi:hypothetical protein
MSLDKAVEAIIREAQARGEFEDLPGKGKPIDLTAYFDTPEDIRNAYALLKNAGLVPAEIELLQDIAALKEKLSFTTDPNDRNSLSKSIHEKQLQFNIIMERQKRQRREQ